ncbi:hypothetical protein GQ53DRAFT_772538 [Thozetella sp. PMI_491]|nr:hypothetical protein GQ53DRAFT_772538 [Thozetella sp. PMI_491]
MSRQALPTLAVIYQHLAFKASVVAEVTTRGHDSFQMHLSIPYYVLRSSPFPTTDPRSKDGRPHGPPLRKYRALPFLGQCSTDPSAVYYLYESHVSLLVTGVHDLRWEALLLNDTFIDGEYSQGSIEAVAEARENGFCKNPFFAGEIDEDSLQLSPRAFYIKVSESRFSLALGEWDAVVNCLQVGVENLSIRAATIDVDYRLRNTQ